MARVVVVLEPNGYNPVLKVIEKASPYHRAHQERSYAPRRLDAWVGELGGVIEARRYIGLVPFFCPDGPARLLKRVEPFAERLPLLNRVVCGNYAFRARRSDLLR